MIPRVRIPPRDGLAEIRQHASMRCVFCADAVEAPVDTHSTLLKLRADVGIFHCAAVRRIYESFYHIDYEQAEAAWLEGRTIAMLNKIDQPPEVTVQLGGPYHAAPFRGRRP